MSQHTPGPWKLHIEKDGGDWDYQIRTIKPHNPAGEIGKHIGSTNRFIPEVEANSKLFASAPDLLSACQAMHDALSNILENCASADREGEIEHMHGNEYEIGRDHRARALKAIRKSFRALAKAGEFES